MSELDDLLKKHRKAIVAREEQTFREMLAAYEEIERELKASIRELAAKAAEAKAAGKTLSPAWFYRERRLRALLEQVEAQIVRFGRQVTPIVAREQRAALRLAIEQADDLLRVIARPNAAQTAGSTLGTTWEPILQANGGYRLQGTAVDRPYIVIPHQAVQNWAFQDYFVRSVWFESEHVREFINDFHGEFTAHLGPNDVHPHF